MSVAKNFSNSEISEFSESTLNESISDTTFYEINSSASESADENFNSVLIKKLNVNKGNAFGVKKKNYFRLAK